MLEILPSSPLPPYPGRPSRSCFRDCAATFYNALLLGGTFLIVAEKSPAMS